MVRVMVMVMMGVAVGAAAVHFAGWILQRIGPTVKKKERKEEKYQAEKLQHSVWGIVKFLNFQSGNDIGQSKFEANIIEFTLRIKFGIYLPFHL